MNSDYGPAIVKVATGGHATGVDIHIDNSKNDILPQLFQAPCRDLFIVVYLVCLQQTVCCDSRLCVNEAAETT